MSTSGPAALARGARILLAIPFMLSLQVSLSGCNCTSSDETKQSAQASKQAEAEVEQEREDAADTDAKPPTIASSVGSRASKKTVRKTERVEREAANQGANDANTRTIADDPRLRALVDDAAGKTLHIPEGALDHFYAQLAPLSKEPPEDLSPGTEGPQLVRVLHIGDSFIGQDVFPHAIRRRMQARFGDAGPGFQLADIHHRSNISRALALRSEHFRSSFVRDAGRNNIGRFGYGGHIARGGPGATSWLSPRDPIPFASGQGHAEIWFQKHPRGAQLQISVGETVKKIDTRSDEIRDAWVRIPLTTPNSELRIAARGEGRLFVYGAVFETGKRGVVWDSTVHGATFTNRLLSQHPEHFAGQIAHRKVDLLVFNFGGNDLRRVAKRSVSQDEFAAEIGEVIDLYRSGRPEMSCLVVSSTDHGRSGRMRVLPAHVETVVGAQRAAAEAKGCAFFDSLSAFGGVGMAQVWAKRIHPLVARDRSHLTSLGRELLAEILVAELVRNQP